MATTSIFRLELLLHKNSLTFSFDKKTETYLAFKGKTLVGTSKELTKLISKLHKEMRDREIN